MYKVSPYQGVILLIALITLIFLVQVEASARGNFCNDQSGVGGCDNQNTNLYCIEGRCTCPDYLNSNHAHANLRSGLSTLWNETLGKCVALKGALCHRITAENPNSPGIPCQQQYKCVASSNDQVMGICGDAPSTVRISTTLILLGLGIGLLRSFASAS